MKKQILGFLAMCLIAFAGSSFMMENSGPTIMVSKGKFSINGNTLSKPWQISAAKKALGEPDRTKDGYNKTHTYDKLSIVLFEKASSSGYSGELTEFQLYFSVPDANDVTPNGSGFSGKLKVDNLVVTEELTATQMLSKLKKWKKTDSYIEHSYRMASKGIYIYFQFNDAETKLVKVSIGPDKSASK